MPLVTWDGRDAVGVIFGLCVVFAVMCWFAHKLQTVRFGEGNGLAEYRARHPECVRRGRVTCYICGSPSIWAERAIKGEECFTHRCRACSTPLYQTNPSQAGKPQHRNLRDWIETEQRKRDMQKAERIDADHTAERKEPFFERESGR